MLAIWILLGVGFGGTLVICFIGGMSDAKTDWGRSHAGNLRDANYCLWPLWWHAWFCGYVIQRNKMSRRGFKEKPSRFSKRQKLAQEVFDKYDERL